MKLTTIDEILSGISVQFMEKTAQSLPVGIVRERLLRGLEKNSEVDQSGKPRYHTKRQLYTYDIRNPNTYVAGSGRPHDVKSHRSVGRDQINEARAAGDSLDRAQAALHGGRNSLAGRHLEQTVKKRYADQLVRLGGGNTPEPFKSTRNAAQLGLHSGNRWSPMDPDLVAERRKFYTYPVTPENSLGSRVGKLVAPVANRSGRALAGITGLPARTRPVPSNSAGDQFSGVRDAFSKKPQSGSAAAPVLARYGE